MGIDMGRAVLAGLIGTAAMTAVGVFIAPMMGLPPMNPAEMLAGAMGGNMMLGWAGHLMIGVVLAFAYALVRENLPGPAPARGALFSIAPFLLAQLAVMPMMGMPLFSGSAAMAMGSFGGHLVYGAVMASVYGKADTMGADTT